LFELLHPSFFFLPPGGVFYTEICVSMVDMKFVHGGDTTGGDLTIDSGEGA
jgi:hypothetical protein